MELAYGSHRGSSWPCRLAAATVAAQKERGRYYRHVKGVSVGEFGVNGR